MKTATLRDYERLMKERPAKMTAEQVGFRMLAEDPARSCGTCWNFYHGKVAGRNVCEITTGPDPESRHIPAEAGCKFWTLDGKTFPILESSSGSGRKKKKPAFEPSYG